MFVVLFLFRTGAPYSNAGDTTQGIEAEGSGEKEENVDSMTVGELKEALKARGLKIGGVKGLVLLFLVYDDHLYVLGTARRALFHLGLLDCLEICVGNRVCKAHVSIFRAAPNAWRD